MPDRSARRVLNAWLDRLAPAEEAVARARWDAACDATDEHRQTVEDATRLRDLRLHDEEGYARIERSLEEGVEDPLLRRALETLRLELLPYRVARPEALVGLEADLAERFARFRANVEGRRLAAHEVARILRTSTDGAHLERTWRAQVAVGAEVAERVRDAVRLRNAHARALGFDDFRALRLHVTEVDASFLDGFLGELAQGTDETWRVEKGRIDERLATRYGTGGGPLAPWHYGDVFLQALPPEVERPDPFEGKDPVGLARRTFEGVGLGVEAALVRSDLYPRDGKNPHAFCTHLDRAGDVRVLANVVPNERWTRTLLHELGHAVYDLGLDRDLPWNLVRPPQAALTEGVAMLFDRLVHDPAWRRRVADLPAEPEAAARARADLLTFVRWALVVCRFEERLYANPDRDLDGVWWDLVGRYQGIARPDPLPPGVWAAKIHVACFPAYYHAYLLGHGVASQLAHHLRSATGDAGLVGNREVGRTLQASVFRPAARLRWEERLESATGSGPRASALLHDLVPPRHAASP